MSTSNNNNTHSIPVEKLPLNENSSLKELDEAYASILRQRQVAMITKQLSFTLDLIDTYDPFAVKMTGFMDKVNNEIKNEMSKTSK
jgi:hypothetical protein